MKLKNWQQFGRRLARMDRAELRFRLHQELAQRQDSALAFLGFDFTRNSRNAVGSGDANFFFSRDSIDPILALLRERLPDQVERIVQQAEKICRHRFDLLGYEDLDYGSPIDWHLDAVHGKRAPRKAFYRVRYLDYAEVGDSKVTWELNRHQHLVTLAKAYRLTGDRHFADEILRQWRDWQAENPYPVGINWASSLEAAFRSLSWIWTYHLLEGSPALPEFRDGWLRGLALHGRHIERYLSTYFAPNTHLLGEGVALFFLGVLGPELAAAERWKSLGWEIVLREAERQVQADGFHFEQSTYYHVYALDFFLHSAVLANLNNVPAPHNFEAVLEKMLNALCLLGRGGSPPRFGDDDGGRLFDPRRNRSEHLLDPLATGAILFNRGDYKAAAGDLREETIWLLGVEGVRRWDELEAISPSMESADLPSAGFYLLTAPQAAAQLAVDAGPQGWGRGGHGHADALSVFLGSHGNSLLLDPGTYEYIGEGGDRDLFRGTAVHNTLQVDGANQAEIATPFAWKRLTQSRVEQWIQGEGFDLLVASHDGYQRLPEPATHRRWVLSLKNGVYLVRDLVEGKGKHRLDISWHLSNDLQLVEENVFRVKSGSHGLAILPAQASGLGEPAWMQEVRKECWSPVYGKKAPMTVLNLSINTVLPAEYACLLVTLEEVHGKAGAFARMSCQQPDSPLDAYRYESPKGKYLFYFGRRGERWRQDPLSSDAEFVCWRRTPGSAHERLIFGNGSYVAIDRGPELWFKRKVSWAEAVFGEGEIKMFSSDPEAVEEKPTASDRRVPIPRNL
jgi:hypothetical protein